MCCWSHRWNFLQFFNQCLVSRNTQIHDTKTKPNRQHRAEKHARDSIYTKIKCEQDRDREFARFHVKFRTIALSHCLSIEYILEKMSQRDLLQVLRIYTNIAERKESLLSQFRQEYHIHFVCTCFRMLHFQCFCWFVCLFVCLFGVRVTEWVSSICPFAVCAYNQKH